MIGLAVMGANLAQNIESRGYPVAVHNRTWETTAKFMESVKGKQFVPSKTLEEFVQSMESPRQIFMMVKAGKAVDDLIDQLIPLVSKGDILIDGGNTYYKDTVLRENKCRAAGVHFMGVGISGGEEGARHGPSLMPGGPKDAWEIMSPLLKKIAAQAEGAPCVAHMGPDGAGHFVKMVHNGIEYGDMQLIAEAYDLLSRVGELQPADLGKTFLEWNQGPLHSFLIEITSKVFQKKDEEGKGFLVDKILDKAGQKGTGRWTVEIALELGIPIPTIAAAVDARNLSALKAERVRASESFAAPKVPAIGRDFVAQVHDALYAAKILSYAQGMALMRATSNEKRWGLKLNEIAAIWRGGCIIRARFLNEITRAYEKNPNLENLVLDGFMRDALNRSVPNLRRCMALAAEAGIPLPAFSASLAYFDSYRTGRLPQNLTQAQRDFFGAHTFERTDKPGTFHAQWQD